MNLLADALRSAAREVGRQIARDLYRAAVAELTAAMPGSSRRQPTPRPAGVHAGHGYTKPIPLCGAPLSRTTGGETVVGLCERHPGHDGPHHGLT